MRTIIPKNAKLVPKQAKLVFKGIIYDTYHWQQQLFDGTTETFEMLKRPDSVKVIAIKDDELVILEQEQPMRDAFYDIPGGIHDHKNESELEAIQRELLEETGLSFKTWRLLKVVQPNSKIEQFVYTFLATDFESQKEQSLDGGERIKMLLEPFNDAKKMLSSEKSRHLPKEIEQTNSLDDLLNLPDYPSFHNPNKYQ